MRTDMEVSKAARQRCADLSSQVVEERGWNTIYDPSHFTKNCDCHAIAFTHHVQRTSDTMREIVNVCQNGGGDWYSQLSRIEDLARPFILPEPEVDPLVEALREAFPHVNIEFLTEKFIAALAKSGKKIMIEEAE